jgi:signal peptidase
VKTFKTFVALLVPLLLAACIVVLATGAVSYKVYVIHTGSMSPTIPSGSAVLVDEGHYHIGQVITLTEDGLTVTHRLVSISSGGLTTTKGDANRTADPFHVPTSQIIGGVVFAPRDVGYGIIYLKSPLGLASLVLGILIIWQIWALTGGDVANAKTPARPAHLRARTSLVHVVRSRHAVRKAARSDEGSPAEIDEQSGADDAESVNAVFSGSPVSEVDLN